MNQFLNLAYHNIHLTILESELKPFRNKNGIANELEWTFQHVAMIKALLVNAFRVRVTTGRGTIKLKRTYIESTGGWSYSFLHSRISLP